MIFDRLGGRKSIKNQSKIDPKTDRKQDASWDGFWIAVRSTFDRFWAQLGGQIGAKLAPTSREMGYQDDVKKSSNKKSRKGTRVVREWSGVQAPKESLWDPLILEY